VVLASLTCIWTRAHAAPLLAPRLLLSHHGPQTLMVTCAHELGNHHADEKGWCVFVHGMIYAQLALTQCVSITALLASKYLF